MASQSDNLQPWDVWDEYEEEFINDGVEWDVPVDTSMQDSSRFQNEYPFDERSTLASMYSGSKEEKTEVTPIHRPQDPPEAWHEQLQPLEQLPPHTFSRIPNAHYYQLQPTEEAYSNSTPSSAERLLDVPNTTVQTPQMWSDEEELSSNASTTSLALTSLCPPTLARENMGSVPKIYSPVEEIGEEKTEVTPIHQPHGPPEAWHEQLQPLEELPPHTFSRIPNSHYYQLQPTEEAYHPTTPSSAERPVDVPIATVQTPQMWSDEEEPSSHASTTSPALTSLCPPALAREDIESVPTFYSSVAEIREDQEHTFPENRSMNALVPYDASRQYGEAPKKDRNTSWKLCVLLLLLLLMVLVLVLLILYFVVFKDDEAPASVTMSPTPTSPLGPLPQSPIDPNVSCYGSFTTLTADIVAKYDSLMTAHVVPTLYSTWDHSIDSCHPANQALLWLSTESTGEGSGDLVQRYIMAFFYFATEGPSWKEQDKWLSKCSVCDWEGVGCTGDGGLLKMSLASNGLKGLVISELGYLSKLQVVALQGNALSGSLPVQVASLANMHIVSLSQNSLIGTLPSQLDASAATLEHLKLGGNSFTGSLPTQLGRALLLKTLDLGRNSFSGALPTEINQLTKLSFFNLESNPQITGRIPAEFGTFTDLSFLSISNTAIRARIPRQYAALNKLEELRMANTLVGGDIPEAVANMTELKHLALSGSRFRKSIPSSLGTLGKLTHLSLHNNSFTGLVPTQIGLLSDTRILTLDDNLFTGNVPTEFAALSKLEVITLHHSFLTGRIPDDLCSLRSLELEIFTVPCPRRTESGDHWGVTCAVPTCCSACIGPLQSSRP